MPYNAKKRVLLTTHRPYLLFYLIASLSLGVTLLTHPFMVYPFDIYTHLHWIDKQHEATTIATRHTWHALWAEFFELFNIQRDQIFLRAGVIHHTQLILTLLLIFSASLMIFRLLLHSMKRAELLWLSYWSTLIWVSIFSTLSQGHHQVWILWYSVNYQITLPMTLLSLALSLSLLYQPLSWRLRAIYFITILLLSYAILKLHAMEYLYFLLYLLLIVVIFSDKLFRLYRRYWRWAIVATLLFLWILPPMIEWLVSYSYRGSVLMEYMAWEKLPTLYEEIMRRGERVVAHYNKASSSINALMVASLASGVLLALLLLYRYLRYKERIIHLRLFIFLLFASFFIVIPLNKFLIGLVAFIIYESVSHRLYYSSLLFLMLPLFVYYLLHLMKIQFRYAFHVVMASVLLGLFAYSSSLISQGNYAKNIDSIVSMFDAQKMQFNLNEEEIKEVGKRLRHYEQSNRQGKPLYFYARDDIAFVLKFIYQQKVLYYDRGTKDYQESFKGHKQRNYTPILFETPLHFPSYARFKSRE
jgi:hypothetical protein